MTKQSQSKRTHENGVGSSMLNFAPKPVQEKVNKRRRRKEEEEFRKLQEQRAEEAQRGEFAPPLTP